jgi:hypothetical protein
MRRRRREERVGRLGQPSPAGYRATAGLDAVCGLILGVIFAAAVLDLAIFGRRLCEARLIGKPPAPVRSGFRSGRRRRDQFMPLGPDGGIGFCVAPA